MNTIYYNGQWLKDDAIFHFNDRLRLGDGVFDTMLVIVEGGKAKLIHAERHYERLLTDIKLLEITPVPHQGELIDIAQNLCTKNAPEDGRYALNTLITRGVGQRGLMPPEGAAPSVALRLSSVPDTFPPIKAITARRAFRNEGSPLSQIKSCNYGDNILVLIEARNKGANEAIMFNNKGRVACATSGNIFAVINGTLYTPPLSDGVLNGITRQILMEKHKVIESSLTIEDLKNSEGLYITNSIRGCMPLTTLNGQDMPAPAIKIDQDFHLS